MRRRNCSGVMSHLILIVFQSCKFEGNMSPKKASMEGEVMIMLVQSMKGMTKRTEVIDIEVTQGYFSEIGNYNI